VTQHGYALRHAALQLKANGKIVLKAVERHGCALQSASLKLKADRVFMLEAFRRKWIFA